MKYLLTVPGKFHLHSVIEDFLELPGSNTLIVITSSPGVKMNNDRVKIFWLPMFFQIIFRKILKVHQPTLFKYLDFLLFDAICSLFVSRKIIFVGFAGISLITGKKSQRLGGKYFLDRACPYFPVQYALIRDEYLLSNLDPPFVNHIMEKRLISEYEVCDKIMVPSKFSFKSYPDSLANKVQLYKLRIKSFLWDDSNTDFNRSFIKFGFVGGDYIRKGVNTLVDAFAFIFENYDDVKLLIKMNKREFLKTKKSKHFCDKYFNKLEFIEYLPNIGDFYTDIDYLVLPSIDEGFGMVVMESIFCKTPVIISDNVGAKDFISSSTLNFVFEVNNSMDLIEKLTSAIDVIKSDSSALLRQECLNVFNDYYNKKLSYFEYCDK